MMKFNLAKFTLFSSASVEMAMGVVLNEYQGLSTLSMATDAPDIFDFSQSCVIPDDPEDPEAMSQIDIQTSNDGFAATVEAAQVSPDYNDSLSGD